jgi:hypothetical protein
MQCALVGRNEMSGRDPHNDAIIALCDSDERCLDILGTFCVSWHPRPYRDGVDQWPSVVNGNWLALTSKSFRIGKFLSRPVEMSFLERKKWLWMKPDFYRVPEVISSQIVEQAVIPYSSINYVNFREVRSVDLIDSSKNFWHWSGVWEQLGVQKLDALFTIPEVIFALNGHVQCHYAIDDHWSEFCEHLARLVADSQKN